MTKRAVIYCRVSTDEQARSGTSLDKQAEACQKYATSHGFQIVDTLKDDYTGTTPIEQRPEGRKAYAILIGNDADALIVFSIDRLVRPPEDGDEWDIPILIRGLARVGKEIHTVELGKIENTFVGLLLAVVGAKTAGDERRKILERMKDGKLRKAKKGWVGVGIPFGYTKVGKRAEAYLEINPLEADLVRRIFDLYLGLSGETAIGMDKLAQLFNAEGIPVTGRNRKKPTDQGTNYTWSASSMREILSNRAYIGEFIWAGEVVTIPDLAIIDRETFDAAQVQKGTNRSNAKRNVKYDYLLQGRITCTCARKMTAINYPRDGKVYLYYRCNRKAYDATPNCESKMLTAELSDRVAWDWLKDVFKNPEKLLEGLREYQARQRDKAEPNKRRLAELPGLIKECEAQARRLTKSLERVPEDDELTAKNIEESLGQISAAHKRYTAERVRIEAELAAIEVSESDIQQILEWAREIGQAIDDDAISFEAKRKMLERLKVTAQIEYQNDERGLRMNCPVLPYASKWRKLSAIADCNSSTATWPITTAIWAKVISSAKKSSTINDRSCGG